eukprot:CAMPEP_0182546390 /NCGR_PEP_ID=MMETSP1323-20130603/35984_1 /TAXON_ID=236787 /ORGANISM="Florenciella parvula, Strain RCC1693" /LENGTH=38 /DNA_ID= /DNA_START= /DNA_END= /DNA_ORIENTATION=
MTSTHMALGVPDFVSGQPTTQAHASCLSTSALSSPQNG